jgi:hypothetical protein
MKQRLGFGVLAIAAFTCASCIGPFQRRLEVDQLEVGMTREAVRSVLGEPDWVEMGMTPEAVRTLFEVSGQALPGGGEGLRATETWAYKRKVVDPAGITRPMTCLEFEDERLVAWRFPSGNDCMEEGAVTGEEMVFDPEVDAYLVAGCNPTDDREHCAPYYRQGFFYRRDADGWCRGLLPLGPFGHIDVVDVPIKIFECEDTATYANTNVRIEAIKADRWKAAKNLTAMRKLEQTAIRLEEIAEIKALEESYDAEIKAIKKTEKQAIAQAEAGTEGKLTKVTIQAASQEAASQVKASQHAKKAAIEATANQAKAKISAIEGPKRTYRSSRRNSGGSSGGSSVDSGSSGGGGTSGGSATSGGGGSSGGGGGGARGGGGRGNRGGGGDRGSH